MREHGAEVPCTAGAAKPDAGEPNNVSCWRSADGEDTSVSWCRSTKLHGRQFGETLLMLRLAKGTQLG